MFLVIELKKTAIRGLFFISIMFCAALLVNIRLNSDGSLTSNKDFIDKEEMSIILQELFNYRNRMLLTNDVKKVEALYDTGQKVGLWAFEHQARRIRYLHNWADKQGVRFIDIKTKLKVRWVKKKNDIITSNIVASTEYKYVYEDSPGQNSPEQNSLAKDLPSKINMFRIGTYHLLDLKVLNQKWLITREWYTDPFADSLRLDNIKTKENKEYIKAQKPQDFSQLAQRRLDAVAYADQYCGAAANEEYEYVYNKKYRNYNPLGGDCANFASQILHEGGKFRKTRAWNYQRGGSPAWVNAQAFKDFMVGSKRASLIASGSYDQVLKASYQLLPGDFIAYEKKGRVTHISVVTGADTKGYTYVNSHNTDRYHVPWDLGWSNRGIKFWLVRVHY